MLYKQHSPHLLLRVFILCRKNPVPALNSDNKVITILAVITIFCYVQGYSKEV